MNIGVLLAVRTVSKRLPLKTLRSVQGRPVLVHTVERLARARRPQGVVICTSTHPGDDIIADLADVHGWKCFRGSEEDVLDRFHAAAQEYRFDLVVRATADNMFVCPEHIDWMIEKHLAADADWTTVDYLPWGMKSETISFRAIERAHVFAEDTSMSEYLTWYFDQPQYFRTLRLEAAPEYHRPNYRVTMDTADDLAAMRRICESFDKPPAEITTREIIDLLDRSPDIVAINAQVPDRIYDKTVRAKVNTRILDTPRSVEMRVVDASDARPSTGPHLARIEAAGLSPLPAIQIAPDLWIGDEHPVFVIAEIGQNHNGSVDIAKQLIDVAAMYQASAVKSCKRDVASELTQEAWNKPYEGPQSFGRTYGEHRQALELSPEQHAELAAYCRGKGLEYFCSACDIPSVEAMENIGVKLYKVASRDITNLPLLERMAQTRKPIILAAGMADADDLADAIITIRKHHNQIVVLQCTSEYPTPYEDCNLLAIHTIRRSFNVLTGLSDHTIGVMTSPVAASLGACVVEKHLTLAHFMRGTDHACSLEPDGLRRVVRDIRNCERALGSGALAVPEGVRYAREKLGRSIVSRVPIAAGTVVTAEMLCLKSPGTGLKWRDRDRLAGRRAKRDIPADTTLDAADFE